MSCLSDNLDGCSGDSVPIGVTYSNCENRCEPNEYALVCGGVGTRTLAYGTYGMP